MEDTLRKKHKGNGGRSKRHAHTDAGKEKGNGGHFPKVGRKDEGNGGYSPEKQKNWGSNRGMEDTLNIMRRRTRGRKRGMEDTFKRTLFKAFRVPWGYTCAGGGCSYYCRRHHFYNAC